MDKPTTNHDSPAIRSKGDEECMEHVLESEKIRERMLKAKARKARNQRRYYQKYVHLFLPSHFSVHTELAPSNRELEQEKGRRRSAK